MHCDRVVSPSLRPRLLATANVFCKRGYGRDSYARIALLGKEGMYAVVEIGKQENFSGWESVQKGRLVYAIERTRFDFANASSCVGKDSVSGRWQYKRQGRTSLWP
jgi:hypothetical protein